MSGGNFTVNDILTKSTFKFLKSFIPTYLISGNYSADLSYTAVDYVDEPHTVSKDRYIDGKLQVVSVTETRRKAVTTHRHKRIDPTRFTELAVATDLLNFLDFYHDSHKLYSFCEDLDSVKGELKSFEEKLTEKTTIALG